MYHNAILLRPSRHSKFDVRPWTPAQVFGASFLFGPVAAGLVLGEHAARLGQTANRLLWFFAGSAVALILLAVSVATPDDRAARLGWAAGVGVGLIASAIAKRISRRAGVDPTEKYTGPGGVGRLFALGFAGLAIQLAVALPVLFASIR